MVLEWGQDMKVEIFVIMIYSRAVKMRFLGLNSRIKSLGLFNDDQNADCFFARLPTIHAI